jgi:hypothetical protein
VRYTECVDVFLICDMSSVVLVGLSPSLILLPFYLVESGGVSMLTVQPLKQYVLDPGS